MHYTEIASFLKQFRFSFETEKELQRQIETKFQEYKICYDRECILSKGETPDFMIGDVCVEVKTKGGKVAIYKQMERYASHDRVKSLILVTNRSMGLPVAINNKPACQVSLGRAWL